MAGGRKAAATGGGRTDSSSEEEYVPLARRRQLQQERVVAQLRAQKAATLQKIGLTAEPAAAGEPAPAAAASPAVSAAPPATTAAPPASAAAPAASCSLLEEAQLAADAATAAGGGDGGAVSAAALEKLKQEEAQMIKLLEKSSSAPLTSVQEAAKGVVHTRRLKTDYELRPTVAALSAEAVRALRKKHSIDVMGNDVPPPVTRFADMRFPRCVLDCLAAMGVERPTPIQMQGLPAALLGRDVIGIAFTGSGKTIVFALPMILQGLRAELRLPLERGEGPVGLVICPSRELASQTHATIERFVGAVADDPRFPRLRAACIIGGASVADQTRALAAMNGVHFVVATPGRLNDFLSKRRMSVAQITYLVLDEADRLIDQGFDEDVKNILSFFNHQRQTLLFSATMPPKFQAFARHALVDPVLINVGRAGAANLNVLQEVEYVKQEEKLPYLLQCLHKTAPPVVIFCENKRSVDRVFEYLLLKGVEAAAIHGSLSQEERHTALEAFRAGTKDVLIGTDVASKGLDFPTIQHVINFDMPREIENYVHRIGRTGRRGRTGVATTFVNKNESENTLLDLKALLLEAKQKVPPFLEALGADNAFALEIGGVRGCAYCGGLGHRIAQCTKLDAQTAAVGAGRSENRAATVTAARFDGGGNYGGDW